MGAQDKAKEPGAVPAGAAHGGRGADVPGSGASCRGGSTPDSSVSYQGVGAPGDGASYQDADMPDCSSTWAHAVLDVIDRRSSTRQFASVPVTDEQRAAVLHAASRAPSAGAMMMYSIISIRERATLERLAVLCDNQPFIATASWALVFVVDYAKWIDLFDHVGCFEPAFVERTGKQPRRAPGLGEFAIAAQDAVIAAQTAVIAAEAVGLGSCYIGDVVEQAEEVARLLDLPPYTLPLSMLVLGVPAKERPATPHPVENLVMEERYQRAGKEELDRQVAEMDAMFRPHAREAGERVRDIYTRKHTSAFMAEMGRSMARWLQNWTGEAPLQP